jgi:outer membrane protein assembly factor BamB
MKITEISFIPKSEQKRALIYSEHSSQARSLHLFYQHETTAQQQFLLAAFEETVRSYLSPSDLKPPLAWLPFLIEHFESLQEDRELTLGDLQGMGLNLVLQEGRNVFLLTSLEHQVQVRYGEKVLCLGSEADALFERLDPFPAPPQEELFPRRLRDAVAVFKLTRPRDLSFEIVLACREDELGVIFSAIRDTGPQDRGEIQEVPLDVLSKRALYLRFYGYPESFEMEGEKDTKEISLRAPFGRIHTAAIVATAAVVFIAGAAWISGRSPKNSSDKAAGPVSQPVQASNVQPSAEPVSGEKDPSQHPSMAEDLVDLASVRLAFAWSKKFGKAVTSSPLMIGPRVIFGCRDGKMRALNAESGNEVWTHEAADGIGASPAVAGKKIIGADYTGEVFALDAETGNRLWSSKLPGRVVSSPCVLGDRVLVGCFDNFAYCLSLLDGQVLWNADAEGKVWGSAAAINETFFLPSYDGNLYALSAGTGEIKWTYNIGGEVRCSPAVIEGNVIVGAADGRLHAVDSATGKDVWIFTAGAPINSAVFATDGRVYFGSNDMHLFCVDAKQGTLKWKCKTGGYVLGKPIMIGGLIFIGSYDKTMYCLNAETGAIIDRFQTSGKIYSSPAANSNRLFFGNNEGEFFCLNYSNEKTS